MFIWSINRWLGGLYVLLFLRMLQIFPGLLCTEKTLISMIHAKWAFTGSQNMHILLSLYKATAIQMDCTGLHNCIKLKQTHWRPFVLMCTWDLIINLDKATVEEALSVNMKGADYQLLGCRDKCWKVYLDRDWLPPLFPLLSVSYNKSLATYLFKACPHCSQQEILILVTSINLHNNLPSIFCSLTHSLVGKDWMSTNSSQKCSKYQTWFQLSRGPQSRTIHTVR